jgi:hypothetical protein
LDLDAKIAKVEAEIKERKQLLNELRAQKRAQKHADKDLLSWQDLKTRAQDKTPLTVIKNHRSSYWADQNLYSFSFYETKNILIEGRSESSDDGRVRLVVRVRKDFGEAPYLKKQKTYDTVDAAIKDAANVADKALRQAHIKIGKQRTAQGLPV